MFETIYAQLLLAVAILVITFAFVKGDEPERLAAAAYTMCTLATVMLGDGSSPSVPRWGFMGIEIVLLVVFVGIAWKSQRNWLIWAAAAQVLTVTSHVLIVANLRPPRDAVAAVINMSSYGVLIAMAIGTFWAWQERRAAGLK
ncbi:hypothetical protein [Brevundimonas sp.]|uniref:hypothetical protein n=1 Tax=Brevundimonas sp. TaxID=1871086 RepID=UPI002731982F|nr:hypothetical protein [Brevundimonas sp.]MDP1911846.1 hypothetical protein [Brevundimonas sp.]